jgi:RHS repeat-associated protein
MYDRRGRINRVLYPGDDNQPVIEVEYKYTSGSQVAAIIARDLTKGELTDIYCMEYEYDANGRKIRQVIKEREDDADTDAYYVTAFNYDSRDMLVEEKYLRWDDNNSEWDVMYWARYKYDTAGNMVERVVNQIVNGNAKDYIDSSFTYSRGYQLTGFYRIADSGSETRPFTLSYDANGNMTHIEQNQAFTDSFYDITEMEFQFDEKNRMTQYRFGGAGSWYQIKYDALGRVRERVDLTPTTTKYYSDGRQLVQQLDSSNNVEFDYFRGPTGLMRQWQENGTTKKRFYIKDNLNTVWALVDPSNLGVTRYNYNAWGEHLDKDDTGFPTDGNWMRYIGCRVEAFAKSNAQTGAIYHLDHRHYSPVTRFLQRDPLGKIGFGLSLGNPYAYAANNPQNLSDPRGLFGCGGLGPCLPSLAAWPSPYGVGSAILAPGIFPPGPLPPPPGAELEIEIYLPKWLIEWLKKLLKWFLGLGPYPGQIFQTYGPSDGGYGGNVGGTWVEFPPIGPSEEDPGVYPDCFQGCSDAYYRISLGWIRPKHRECLHRCVLFCTETMPYEKGYNYFVNCMRFG